MTQPPVQPPLISPGTLPRPLRTARVIVWIQTAATLLLLVIQFVELASIEQHGEELSTLGQFEIIENPIVAVLAIVAAIFIAARRRWVRPLVIVVEALAAINGLINLVNGLYAGIVGFGLAVVVASLMMRPEVGAWGNSTESG